MGIAMSANASTVSVAGFRLLRQNVNGCFWLGFGEKPWHGNCPLSSADSDRLQAHQKTYPSIEENAVAKKKSASKKVVSKKRGKKANLAKQQGGASFSEQDPKRRLGNFTGAGEHARQGSRTAGIVGQTKQRNHTDRSGKK